MFIEVATLDEIPEGSAIGVDVKDQGYVLLRKDDQIYCYLNNCPHLRVRLECQPNQFLDYERQFIQCATHGALFTLDSGLCVSGPCRGQSLKAIETRVEQNRIMIHPQPPSDSINLRMR